MTAVYSPFTSAADLTALLERLRDHYGVELAEGVGPFFGKSFRIGHLGTFGHDDVMRVLDRLRLALVDVGVSPAVNHHPALAAA